MKQLQWVWSLVRDVSLTDKGGVNVKFVIDRFEGNVAIVEMQDGDTVECPKMLLPKGSKEGDILCIFVDKEATEGKKKILTNRMNKLFND